ncbi:SH3 domain-containing protein [Caloramator quimbayensis]|uniref:N-acetylmuramoyl-L-alanine amidase n=1 Tax=Caloramator quimbayensis TaxID=1147123 RepID=A0A1T4XM36_9CLOT|nr:N-acetylmuramoyl-L-alanine amidase [Caloramator quimbayensis]SKA90586.1 SH3 domain-containing protein [Caloramator quimbayensis]
MLPIKVMLLTNKNRPKIKLKKLKGIVIHWTANTGKGADALANRNYFNSTDRAASAHFIVDDHQIIQCILEDEVAFHVGANKYRSAGEKIREGSFGPNYFLLGIEMCVNSDGNFNKTYENTVELAAYLLKKHKLSINDLYRHYDITGKDCPKMLIDENQWQKFKNDVNKILNNYPKDEGSTKPVAAVKEKIGIVTASILNCREQPTLNSKINGKLIKGTKVKIYDVKNGWYLVNNKMPQWVSKEYVSLI